MRDGYHIIDCDRHVIEPADLWDKYLDAPYKHYVGWHINPWYGDMDPEVQDAVCRAYNTWLHEFCSVAPDRMFGMALLPLQDISRAERELRRAVEQLGMRGIFWRPNPHFGRLVSDPAYTPLFEAAQDLGVPIAYHEGQHGQGVVLTGGLDRSVELGGWLWLGSGRTETSYLRHAGRHPMEQMAAFLTLVCAGVFDRY